MILVSVNCVICYTINLQDLYEIKTVVHWKGLCTLNLSYNFITLLIINFWYI